MKITVTIFHLKKIFIDNIINFVNFNEIVHIF